MEFWEELLIFYTASSIAPPYCCIYSFSTANYFPINYKEYAVFSFADSIFEIYLRSKLQKNNL